MKDEEIVASEHISSRETTRRARYFDETLIKRYTAELGFVHEKLSSFPRKS